MSAHACAAHVRFVCEDIMRSSTTEGIFRTWAGSEAGSEEDRGAQRRMSRSQEGGGGDLDVLRCGLVVLAAGFVQPQSLLVQVVHAPLHKEGPGKR